jgi:hypothetical protein
MRVGRILAGAAAAGALLIATAAGPMPAPALAGPAVTIVPATVTAFGQLITVHVTGCPPGGPIAVASTTDARSATTLSADGVGSATTSVSSGGAAGTFTVTAQCGGATASARLTVVARSPGAGDDAGAATASLKIIAIAAAVAVGGLLTVLALLALRRRTLLT